MSFATFSFDYAVSGGGYVDPASISGLAAWYDFSDISTLFQNTIATVPVTTDGQGIARANDKSGKGRNILQGGAGAPVYKTGIQGGLSVGRFTGVNDWLTSTSFVQSAAGGGCLIGVAKFSTYVSGTQTAAGFRSNATPLISTMAIQRASANTGTGAASDGVSANSTDTQAATDDVFHVFTLTKGAGTNILLRVDGTGTQTVAVFSPNTSGQTFSIGSRASSSADLMIGDVAEVILYDNNIGATAYAALEVSLKRKWGTA